MLCTIGGGIIEAVGDGLRQRGNSWLETVRIQRLRSEAESVAEEIYKVELQLAEMKTKHRKLLKQAAAIDNSVQAKMASYSSSLRMLEDDIQKFLNFKPSEEATRPASREGKSSIWQLPPKRRNLEMAKEYWSEQHESFVSQRKQTEHEKDALVDGASLWQETVVEVADFEKQLRAEMAMLAPSLTDSHSAWEEPPTTTATERLRDLLRQMGELIASLQRKLQISQDRNWKLLIVAIGAEVDALRRGKEILAGVLGDTGEDVKDEVTEKNDVDGEGQNDEEIIDQLDKSFMTARGVGELSDAEDDDHPNPELLFSKLEDTDTD
jgi:chromosome segregation ATPase